MRKTTLLFFLLLLFVNSLRCQTWLWDTVISNHTGDISLCKDPWNYIYAFNPHANYEHVDFTAIKKIDLHGRLMWQLDLPKSMQIKSLVASADSMIYMGGVFSGTFSLGGSIYTSEKSIDIWVAKYTSSGSFIWCKTIGSSEDEILGNLSANGRSLLITGAAGDTLNFMGLTISKDKSSDFFLASISVSGSVQAIKFSSSIETPYSPYPSSSAYGMECAADEAGNVYVLATFIGINQIDTFRLGLNDQQYLRNISLLKFNDQLEIQYAYNLNWCYMVCPDSYYGLNVNSTGDCYFIHGYDYSQSGNDSHYSMINRMTASGSLIASFQPRPDRKTYISDIDLDQCDNVYYTGNCRGYINNPVYYPSLMNGQVSPSLSPNWIRIDSTSVNYNFRRASALAVLAPNDLFVAGFFSDSLRLANLLTDTNTYYGESEFYARLKFFAQAPCEIPTNIGIVNVDAKERITIYPNPCSDILYIESEAKSKVQVYSYNGILVSEYSLKEDKEKLDINGLSEGIYFIRIKNCAKCKTEKVIVQKQ